MLKLARIMSMAGVFGVGLVFAVIGFSIPASGQG